MLVIQGIFILLSNMVILYLLLSQLNTIIKTTENQMKAEFDQSVCVSPEYKNCMQTRTADKLNKRICLFEKIFALMAKLIIISIMYVVSTVGLYFLPVALLPVGHAVIFPAIAIVIHSTVMYCMFPVAQNFYSFMCYYPHKMIVKHGMLPLYSNETNSTSLQVIQVRPAKQNAKLQKSEISLNSK